MFRPRLTRWVGVLALLTGCVSPPDPVTTSTERTFAFDSTPEHMTLGPGDVISVRVLGHPELSTQGKGTQVDREGRLHLPLIAPQLVLDQGLHDTSEALTTAFAEYLRNPDITVDLVENNSSVYYVLGHVSEPGAKPLDRAMTALEATSAGGHFLRGADRSHVFVLRPHPDGLESHVFNLMAPGSEALVRVRKGDVIFVRQTGAENFQEDWLPIITGLGNTAINADSDGGLFH